MNKNWIKTTLGECAIINDSTYRPREQWPFINYLETGQITDNRIFGIHHFDVGKDKIPASARRKVRPGDIVYSTVRPNKNHFGRIKDVPNNFLVSTAFAVIAGRPYIADTSYIYYYITQKNIIEYFHTLAEHSSSAYPSLQMRDLEEMQILLPPIQQQQSIARILEILDNKIHLNQQMNSTLEEMAGTLFRSWFVDFDPVRAKMEGSWQPDQSLPGLPADLYALFPDQLITSELGEIPEGWMVQPLEYIAQELTKKENPMLSPDIIYHHYSLPAYGNNGLPIIETGDKIKSTKTILQPNVVLVSRIDPENNRVWLVDVQPKDKAISSTEFLVLKPKAYFPREYIYCLARSAPFRTQIQSLITGTSPSHQRAQRTAVMKIQIIVPSNIILRAFETNTSSLLTRLLSNRRESSMLAQMRDTLLPKLLSGEIRVEDLEGVL